MQTSNRPKIVYYDTSNKQGKLDTPLSLGYLASNCPVDHEPVFMWTGNRDFDVLAKADVVAMTALTPGMAEACAVAEGIKGQAAGGRRPTIILGGQGTLWPEVGDHDHFDIVVRGEGLRMWQWMFRRYCLDIEDSRRYINKAPGTLVLDGFIPPPWLDGYKPPRCRPRGDTYPVMSSWGCRSGCRFCTSTRYWHRRVTRFSPIYMVQWLGQIADKYPRVTHIDMQDDTFATDTSWLSGFTGMYERYVLHRRFTMNCMVRSPMVTPELCVRLRRLKVTSVRFGLESASDRLLKLMGKNARVEHHQRAVNLLHEHGLNPTYTVLQYYPGEEPEDRRLTTSFILHNIDKARVQGYYNYVAYPGTEHYDGRDVREGDWYAGER